MCPFPMISKVPFGVEAEVLLRRGNESFCLNKVWTLNRVGTKRTELRLRVKQGHWQGVSACIGPNQPSWWMPAGSS